MYAFLLLALSTALIGDDDARFQAGSDHEVLQALAQGYTANREGVERCRASFVYREGRAPDLETARQGKLSDPAEAKGAYLFDGSRKKYERLFDREQTISHTSTEGEHPGTCEFVSVQLLTDGTTTLSYTPFYNTHTRAFDTHARIMDADNGCDLSFGFTLDLGTKAQNANGFADQLDRAWNHGPRGAKAVRLKRDVPYDGRKVHLATFEFDGGEVSYWVDYQRGCVPLRILYRTAKEGDYNDEYHEQMSLVGGKLWFPARRVNYNLPGRRVRILEVDKIQINTPIADADFQLSFVEPVGVYNVVTRDSYKNVRSFPLSALVDPGPAQVH